MGAIGPAGVTVCLPSLPAHIKLKLYIQYSKSLFAISIERNLLGGHLVYVIMCSIGLTAVFASIFLLPEKPGEEVAPWASPRG